MEASSSRKCSHCASRPRGIDGHDLLHPIHPLRSTLFACSACQRYWTRAYEGSGTFVWLEAEPPDALQR